MKVREETAESPSEGPRRVDRILHASCLIHVPDSYYLRSVGDTVRALIIRMRSPDSVYDTTRIPLLTEWPMLRNRNSPTE